MTAARPDYEPRIIEEAARRLYGKATAVLIGSTVVGAVLGAAFGAVPLTSLGDAWPIPTSFGFATMLFGSLGGCAIGYVVGDARAFSLKLQAQSTLCQLQLERNSFETAKALGALAARKAAPRRDDPRPAPADAQRPATAEPGAVPNPRHDPDAATFPPLRSVAAVAGTPPVSPPVSP